MIIGARVPPGGGAAPRGPAARLARGGRLGEGPGDDNNKKKKKKKKHNNNLFSLQLGEGPGAAAVRRRVNTGTSHDSNLQRFELRV